jgi:hypothetical protein
VTQFRVASLGGTDHEALSSFLNSAKYAVSALVCLGKAMKASAFKSKSGWQPGQPHHAIEELMPPLASENRVGLINEPIVP